MSKLHSQTAAEWSATATGTANTQLVVTQTIQPQNRGFLSAFSVSFSGAVAVAIEVIDQNVTSGRVLWKFQIPAGTFAPIQLSYSSKSIQGDIGDNIKITVPAAGAAIVADACISGY